MLSLGDPGHWGPSPEGHMGISVPRVGRGEGVLPGQGWIVYSQGTFSFVDQQIHLIELAGGDGSIWHQQADP